MRVEASNKADVDVQSAATYYASLKMPPHAICVIETSRVPTMHTDYRMLVPTLQERAQALGDRLIESPSNVQQLERRNARSGYVAYVPPAGIACGRALAAGVPENSAP